jgi:hypothetical protein
MPVTSFHPELGRSQGFGGSRGGVVTTLGVAATPLLVGVAAANSWPHVGKEFYSSLAQVIATLFVAIAVDLFASQASRRSVRDALQLLLLIAQSWFGFFACIRALAGGGTALTAGLAAAGVAAASVLLSLTLYERIRDVSEDSEKDQLIAAVVVTLFLMAPVSLLIF